MYKLTEFRQHIIPSLPHGPFFKDLSLHVAQKSSVWKMSSAVAGKDLGNLELVPELIYSLVRFLCTLCFWLPCYLLFSLPWQSNLFIVDLLSTLSWDIIYCSWVPTSIWALKFYYYKSLFLQHMYFQEKNSGRNESVAPVIAALQILLQAIGNIAINHILRNLM